jgi:hypothetical protein
MFCTVGTDRGAWKGRKDGLKSWKDQGQDQDQEEVEEGRRSS